MGLVLLGGVLLVLAVALTRRLPQPFNLGMGVTVAALGVWAVFVGASRFVALGGGDCVTAALHQARSVDGTLQWSILQETCVAEPTRWRVEVVPQGSWWPVPRVVFRSSGAPQPRGVRVMGPGSLAVVVDGDAPGVTRELPVVLQGPLGTPNRVWQFHAGRGDAPQE